MQKQQIPINDTFKAGIIKYLVKTEYMLTINTSISQVKLEWCHKFLTGMSNWGYNHTYITQAQCDKVKDVINLIKSVKLPKTEAPF
jgi:hypothetical protein